MSRLIAMAKINHKLIDAARRFAACNIGRTWPCEDSMLLGSGIVSKPEVALTIRQPFYLRGSSPDFQPARSKPQ